ncbi:MAG: tail fiber domain-containing protein, partial [Elusimicrobiota bacterium]
IMADGDAVRYDLGQSQTTYNCVENSFVMVSSGATSNYYQVGLFGKSIASFVGTGRVGIGETAPESAMEITSASPIITLHNSTNQDTNNGRESRLEFKGQQSGGEETSLARLAVSHSGTSDDEKGQMVFRVNDGNDGASPSEKMRITDTGNVGIATSIPIGRLQVSGDTVIGGGTSLLRMLGAGGALYIQPSSSTVTGSSADLYFSNWYQGTPKLVIKAGGNIGVGTSEPGEPLNVIGDISSSTTIYAPIGDFSDIYVSTINTKSPLYINNTANNVLITGTGNMGIGNTNPNEKLDVIGDISSSTTIYAPIGDFTNVYVSTIYSKSPLQFATNGINRMTLNDNGYVGIGSTNPASPLDVIVPNGGAARIQTSTLGNEESAFLNFQGRGIIGYSSFTAMGLSGLEMRTPSKHILINTNDTILDNYIFINGTSSDYIKFGTFGTERVIISSSGYLGIGTTNPGALLSLNNSLGNTKLALFDGGSTFYGMGIQSNQFRLHVGNNSGRFSFLDAPSGNELLTIKGTGNVGIGTTEPSVLLHLEKDYSVTTVISKIYDPAMSAGHALRINLGNADSTNNSAQISYTHVGLGSASNYLSLGMYGTLDTLNVTGNSRVGLGTTSPAERLEVNGNITFSGTEGNIKKINELEGANDLKLSGDATNDADIYIHANGNVGIATTNPAAKLYVKGAGGTNTGVIVAYETTDNWVHGGPSANPTTALKLYREGHTSESYANAVDFNLLRYEDSSTNSRTRMDIKLANVTAAPDTNVMTLLSNGNVGIGTTAPAQILQIKGTTNTPVLLIEPLSWSSGNSSEVRLGDTAHYLKATHSGGMIIYDLDKINLEGSNVGIGTANPAKKLHVNGDIQIEGVLISHNIDSGDGPSMVWKDTVHTMAKYSSSARYKENIEVFKDDFYKILTLEPKIYNRKNDPLKKKEIGYIAEEMDAAGLNYLVFYDEQGRPDSINDKKIAVYTNEIVKDNIKKIEDQKDEIDMLKDENKELRARVEEIESLLNK